MRISTSPSTLKTLPPKKLREDWALESGMLMPYEDAQAYTKALLPDQNVRFICLPWPLKNADTVGNNQYIDSIVTTARRARPVHQSAGVLR